MFLKRSAPPTGRRTPRRAIVVAGCLAAVLVPATAQAAPVIDVTPILATGSQVALGDVAQGQLVLANHSTAPEDGAYLTVSELTLVPSCGAELADRNCVIAPGPDPGTITIGDSASGSGACTGSSFSVSDADAVSGKVSFEPDTPVILGAAGAGATCVVSFTYTVNRFPTKDSSGDDGLQTDLVAFTRATASWNGLPAPGLGYATVTVVRDTPDVVVSAPPAIGVGGRLSATATLAGTHPDGSLTFDLFGPADPDCTGTPMYTNTIGVHGNGTFQSPEVPVSVAGTYRWRASYGGDEDNDAVSSDCSADEAATEVVADDGSGSGDDTANSGAGVAAGKRVRLDGFSLTRKTFAPASSATALVAAAAKATSKKKAGTAGGTTIKYKLSRAATVTIVVQRVTSGRRSGTKCVKPTKKLKGAKHCTRYVAVATLKRVHKSGGSKKVPFSGRVGSKALRAGSYRLRAGASAGAGTASAVRTAKFKIVKR